MRSELTGLQTDSSGRLGHERLGAGRPSHPACLWLRICDVLVAEDVVAE
jgi:hypothetical protein